MSGQYLKAWVDLGAERLCNTKNDTAGQSTPEIAETTDDDRLEAKD